MGKFGRKSDTSAVGEVVEPQVEGTEAVETTEKVTGKGSIVPNKYAGKYKDGGSDALAEFIKAECAGKDGFEFTAFFALCRKNGLVDAHVAPYEQAIAAKAHGAEGRARMTLRNRLASIARKNGHLVRLNDEQVSISLPALPSRKKEDAPAAEAA